MMTGSVLTMKEAAHVLFGQNDDNARKRAIALLKRNNVDLIKNGRNHLVRRDVLQKSFWGRCGRGCVAPLLKTQLTTYQGAVLPLRLKYC